MTRALVPAAVVLLLSACATAPQPKPMPPLFAAIADNRQADAIDLIRSGANTSVRYASGETPLDAAVQLGETAVIAALLSAHASPETRLPNGQTPVAEAVLYDKPEALRLLLAAGADANGRMPDGTTPVLLVWLHKDSRVLEQLIEAGADLGAADKTGCSVVCTVFRNIRSASDVEKSKALVKLLVAAGAPITPSPRFQCPETLQVSLAWGAYFRTELARDAGRIAEAGRYNRCAAMQFAGLMAAERARAEALWKRERDASDPTQGGNLAQAVGAGFVAALYGLPLDTFQPSLEWRKSNLRAEAQFADELAEEYEDALMKCNDRQHALEGPL